MFSFWVGLGWVVLFIPQVYAQTRTKKVSCSNISEKIMKYAYDLQFCMALKRQTPRTEEGTVRGVTVRGQQTRNLWQHQLRLDVTRLRVQ